jgi:hypothetical protein
MKPDSAEMLIENLDKVHTTDMGAVRITGNLGLKDEDPVAWCRNKITDGASSITRKGKNWYVETDSCIITVNAYSYTIITAHRKKAE